MVNRHFYVGINFYGTEFSYDSEGWMVLAFSDQNSRHQWLNDNAWSSYLNKYIAEPITSEVARRIMKNRSWDEYAADTGANCLIA